MKMQICILLCCALAGCATGPTNAIGQAPAPANPAISDDQAFAKARTALLASLKDPDSARITNMHRVGDHVCGEVNSKNSFGGYNGPHTFSVDAAGDALIGGESASLGVWVSPCWNDPRRGMPGIIR